MINLQNVTKKYGKTLALDDLSLQIDAPGIYCILGRNGAGKTTLFKTLAGHILPTSGTVTAFGSEVKMLSMPEDVHYVESGAAHFNIKLSALFAAARDVNPRFDTGLAFTLAKKFKLATNKRYKHLSFGMKAMVNAIIALSGGRKVLLLDEPVLGFDPVMRKTFYNLLQESQSKNPKIILISTHIIDEIARVAEKLIIIDKGRMVLFSDIADIDERAYSVTGMAGKVTAATDGLNVIGQTKAGGFLSRYVYDNRIEDGDGYTVAPLSLQDFFVSLVGDNEDGGENGEIGNSKKGEEF